MYKFFKFFIYFYFGCSKKTIHQLPPSSELGRVGDKMITRVITHFHSPYSYDACDYKGHDAKLQKACIEHLKDAMCKNQIDYLFLSDHPKNMENYDFEKLLLYDTDDTLVYKNGKPIANQIKACSNGLRPILMVGFESTLMALGMQEHYGQTPQQRHDYYTSEKPEVVQKMRQATQSLLVIPHTESRTVKFIQEIRPDAIEIYNLHANLDPKIRKKDLKIKPFEPISGLLSYLLDPYKELDADYMFLHFFEWAPIYAKIWNQLIAAGYPVTGLGGTDSHENVFPQKASDGERIDSHRRLTRFLSNHVLVKESSIENIKNALQQSSSWLVFEGFGTPQNIEFYATTPHQTFTPGETVYEKSVLHIQQPKLHSASPQGNQEPTIYAELHYISSTGTDTILHQSQTSFVWAIDQPGAYRVQFYIIPYHIKPWLNSFEKLAEKKYPWIITNHIFLHL